MSGTVLRILCLAAAVFYSAAFAASFGKKAIFAKLSAVFWIGGIAFNGLIVANNRVLNGYMPSVSMYQGHSQENQVLPAGSVSDNCVPM